MPNPDAVEAARVALLADDGDSIRDTARRAVEAAEPHVRKADLEGIKELEGLLEDARIRMDDRLQRLELAEARLTKARKAVLAEVRKAVDFAKAVFHSELVDGPNGENSAKLRHTAKKKLDAAFPEEEK